MLAAKRRRMQTAFAMLARNPAAPPEVLERLYGRADVRANLAVNPSSPPALLAKLAKDDRDVVRSNLLWNPKLPDDVLDVLARDPVLGGAVARVRRRRGFGARWYMMCPPYRWRWHQPFARAFDDAAPPTAWTRAGGNGDGFESREACEGMRAEMVRRESNPNRRVRPEVEGEFPRDFYAHTRCALVSS